MSVNNAQSKDSMEAALGRIPGWEPPPDFVARTAALAVQEGASRHARAGAAAASSVGHEWMALLLRALGLAACVSVAAWLGGELLFALLQSSSAPDQPGALGWVLALGSVLLAWRCTRPRLGAIRRLRA